jgi:hypothetical protein
MYFFFKENRLVITSTLQNYTPRVGPTIQHLHLVRSRNISYSFTETEKTRARIESRIRTDL